MVKYIVKGLLVFDILQFVIGIWCIGPKLGTTGRLCERALLPRQSQTVDWPSMRPCSGFESRLLIINASKANWITCASPNTMTNSTVLSNLIQKILHVHQQYTL